ncbi:MAG: hypothetical protein ACXADW_07080 [Candidatus Hodarchaeales archaeon]
MSDKNGHAKKKWQRILTGTEILKTIRDHGPLPELPERYNEKKPLLNRLGESKWLKK